MPLPISAHIANRLLTALPREEHERFVAHAEPVTLAFGETLAEQGESLHNVYFPTDCFISMITTMDEGTKLETGLIGNEGMLGAFLVLEVDRSPTRALVQGGGPALCMETGQFHRQLANSPGLRRVLKRYLHVMIMQLGQTAVCNRFHLVEARLARWLLMTQDRAHSDGFAITHEFLAFMLGVRRAGISEAASTLQRRNLIRYRRGHLTIMDRDGLEATACGCYSADRETYARTMN